MELREYWQIVRRRLWIVVSLVSVVVAVSVLLRSAPRPTYHATMRFVVGLEPEAKTGDYYKQAGLHAYGVEAFGDVPFVKMIVGDKSNDAPRIFEGTIFFPQAGSQAEEFAAEKGIPSVIIDDVRDFALALAELRRGM